jgi:hypothetical protein
MATTMIMKTMTSLAAMVRVMAMMDGWMGGQTNRGQNI